MESSSFTSRRNVTFMPDGAPAHSADSSMNILETKCKLVWGKGVWPGNSPDLNPIENLWSILKNSVYKETIPKNRQELESKLKKKWKSISLDLLKN
jgi:transposase